MNKVVFSTVILQFKEPASVLAILTPLRPRSWDLQNHDLMEETVTTSLSQLV